MSKALKEAIEKNDAEAARKALKTVKDLKRKLPKASAPLDYACSKGADAVVEVLLEVGAPVNDDGFWGNHPFALAAEKGHAKVIARLAARGAPENVVDQVLWRALLEGKADVVREILASCRPAVTQQAIDVATCWEKGELLDLLVEHGADVNVANDGKSNHDMREKRAIHDAAKGGRVAAIEMLARHGADVNARDGLGLTPLMHLAKGMPELDGEARFRAEIGDQEWGARRLGDRAPGDGMKAFARLIELGADATATDSDGHDARMHYDWARRRESEDENPEFVKLLTKAGAKGGGATSALYEALYGKDVEAAQKALAAGADVNRRAPGGWTPLVIASSLEMVDLLLAAGADPNLASATTTPLISAAVSGELEIVKRLIAAGADIHAIQPRPPGSEYLANAYSASELNSKHEVAEYLKSLGAGKPKLVKWKPLEAGVERWNDFSEILVKGAVADVAAGLARMIGGKAEMSAYGKQVSPGKRAFVVYRPKGMAWCNVIRIAPPPRLFEKPEVMIDLCAEISKACDASVLAVQYSDTSDASDVRRFEPDGSSQRDESMDFEMLQEMVDAMGDEAPEWAREKVARLADGADSAESLPDLAAREKFVVGALGLSCEPGRKLDVDFTGYPAEAFDGVAFVSTR